MSKTTRKAIGIVILVATLAIVAFAIFMYDRAQPLDFEDGDNWVCYEDDHVLDLDIYYIYPTLSSDEDGNMSMKDAEARGRILKAADEIKAKYGDIADVYCPYYRQMTPEADSMNAEDRMDCYVNAYKDVAEGFEFFLNNMNLAKRPFIIIGYGQGAEMAMQLLKDYGKYTETMVAAYLIDYDITEEDLAESEYVKLSESDKDLRVIVTKEEDITIRYNEYLK